MAPRIKPATQEEMNQMQFGAENIKEWDRIHRLAQMIKNGQARIVRDDGQPYTIITRRKR